MPKRVNIQKMVTFYLVFGETSPFRHRLSGYPIPISVGAVFDPFWPGFYSNLSLVRILLSENYINPFLR